MDVKPEAFKRRDQKVGPPSHQRLNQIKKKKKKKSAIYRVEAPRTGIQRQKRYHTLLS